MRQAFSSKTDDNEKALALLEGQHPQKHGGNRILLPYRDREQAAAINRQLVEAGLKVYAIHPQQSDLEQLFIDITSNPA